MGSGCCKAEKVIPVNISKCFSDIIPGKSFDSNLKCHDLSENRDNYPNYTPRIIKWKKGSLIGQGVFGRVYQVLNVDSGELLAVKNQKLSNESAKAERQLQNISREINILRPLSHPNIIRYFQVDYNEEENSVDILMEYVPCGSMNFLLMKYKGLSETAVSNYTRQLLEGLRFLHLNSIIHRDLKSANVLITEESTLKITDFGCSRQFNEDCEGISKSLKGSPYWMAPEVVMRTGHAYPADIWSLGCMVIEMITGVPPWSNYSNETNDVLNLIAKKDSLPTIPQGSAALKDFITKCLNRDPSLRPSASILLDHEFIQLNSVTRCYNSIRSSSLKASISDLVIQNL